MKVRRVLIWLGASIVALLLAATVVLYWASRSETVLHWAIDRFAPSLPCTLTVEGLEGGIMKPVRVEYLTCENADFHFEARTIALVWSAWPLAARRLDISSLSIEALHFTSRINQTQAAPSPPPPPPPPAAPQQLELPIAIRVDSIEIATLVAKRGERSIELRAIDAAYRADKDSHRLSLRNVEYQTGRMAGEATIGTTAPLPLTAKFSVLTEPVEGAPLTADIALTGQLQNISASINANVDEQQALANLELAPFDPQPVRSLEVRASGVDVATFNKRLPHTELAVTLRANSAVDSVLTGQLHAENAIAGQLDLQRLPVQSFDARFDFDGTSLQIPDLKLDLGTAGSAKGAARLAQDQTSLQLDVSNLDLRAVRSNLRKTKLNGNLAAEPRDSVQLVSFDLAQKDLQFEGRAEIGERRVLIERLIARAGAAQLRASATLDRDERLGFSLDGSLTRFDASRFGDFAQSDVNARLQARGNLRPEWRAAVSYELDRSQLAGVPLAGRGKFELSPTHLQSADVALDYGANKLKLTGSFGNRDDTLSFTLDAKRLDQLDKTLSGNVQASGTLGGTIKQPAIKADLKGRAIAVAGAGVDTAQIQLQVDRADDPVIRAQARLQRVKRGERTLDSVAVDVDGTLGNHALQLAATAPDVKLTGRFNGGWDKTRRVWSGTIVQLDNKGEYAFTVKRAAALEVGPDHVVIGATEVDFSQTEIKLGETRYEDGALQTQGSVSGVRAARVLALMKKPPQIESTLVLGARWEIRTNDTVNGFIELTRSSGDIAIAGEEPLALGIKELRVTLRSVANELTAETVLRGAQINAQGSAQTRLEKRGVKWGVPGTAPLRFAGELKMQSMRPLAALASREVTADGELTLAVKANGTVAKPQLSGNVEARNLGIEHAANGVLFKDGLLRATFSDDFLNLTEFTIKGAQGEFNANGRVSMRKDSRSADLQWTARKLAVVKRPAPQLTVSGGGNLSYENNIVSLEGRLSANPGRADLRQTDFQFEGKAEIGERRVLIERLIARAGAAQLRASATLDRDERLGFSLDGSLTRFDASRFGDFAQSDVNARLQARGNLRPEWRAAVSYELDRSQLAGVPLAGRGKFELSPTHLQSADVALDYGANKLKLTGSFGNRDDTLSFTLDAKRLDQLDKTLSGNVQASGTLGGTIKQPAIKADLKGRAIAVAGAGVDTAQIQLQVDRADDPVIRAQARLQRVKRGERTLDSVAVDVDGTLGNHALQLAATAPDVKLTGRFNGGWDKTRRVWSGTIVQLDNKGEYAFTVKRAAALEVGPDHVVIGATEVDFSQTEIKLGETRYEDGALQTQGSVSGVRAARVLALMKKPPQIESTLVLGARWEIRTNDTVNGFIELTRSSGDIAIAGEEPLALGIKELRVTLRSVANELTAETVLRGAQINAQGSAQTRLEKRGVKWGVPGTAPLRFAGELKMQSMRPLAALASREVTADGELTLAVNGSGTIAEPRLSGSVEADKIKIEHVANGVFFEDGLLRASFTDDALTLTEFRLKAGQGELTARGSFSTRKGAPLMNLDWSANKLAVIQHPELRLTVSGAGQLGYQDATVSLKGELTADQGRVELRRRTFPSLGDDVVVAGREERSQLSTERKRANLDLLLDLGSDFTIVGRGLDARLAGQIRLTSSADKPLSADGEIRVASGTFEAYGRRLQIEQGVVYFAGPVNNPGLSIRAMRKNQPVEAGVEVSGTARDPRVRLVSNPEVSDPDKLAWLVLGRQAEYSNAQDNRALQSSATALAAGLGTTPFQQQLAGAVGLDEISFIPGTGQTQGGVVAVGKQLSDRIYVTQEIGTSAAQNTLRVSYQLTRRWSVRTESGETDAVDLFFTFSFD